MRRWILEFPYDILKGVAKAFLLLLNTEDDDVRWVFLNRGSRGKFFVGGRKEMSSCPEIKRATREGEMLEDADF